MNFKFPLEVDYFDAAPPPPAGRSQPSTGVSEFGGNGILSGHTDWDEIRRQKAEDREREAAAAEQAAELRQRCHEVDALAGKYLTEELNRVRVKASPRHLVDFKQFREYCITHGWPFFSCPQSVFEFLVSETEKGADHVSKMATAISRVYCAAGDSDVTQDDLVKALLLQMKQEEENENKTQPAKENDQ
jgi:hypothetical protein